jgi:hypothetical protein
MRGFLRSFRYTIRLLFKSPGLTLTAVLMLGFGVGVNTTIFSTLNPRFPRRISPKSRTALPDLRTYGTAFDPVQNRSPRNKRGNTIRLALVDSPEENHVSAN